MLRVIACLAFLVACQSEDVSRRIGARCDTTTECDQKCLAPGGDWPGGFCTVACTSDADCGDGYRCVAEDGGVCTFSCMADPDCTFLGSGYSCVQVDAIDQSKVMTCHGG